MKTTLSDVSGRYAKALGGLTVLTFLSEAERVLHYLPSKLNSGGTSELTSTNF